ncbi:hypothetical protein ACFQZR_25450 [Paenibacillus sp. GCM10027629]|uniref:hypothetical protein n=1 Tax=Paenibacillus sp. GCM10027629 TaxID=3273414 RepID=UPI0036405EA3
MAIKNLDEEEISADDLALIGAVLTTLGDFMVVLSLLKARAEIKQQQSSANNTIFCK